MADKTGAEVTGNWYGEDVIADVKEGLGEGFYKSAQRIAANARSRVERSDLPITKKHPGHLQDTIRAKKARKKKFMPGAFVFAGDMMKGIYWHFMVEYGTYFKSAHPFMRPAVNANFNATKAEAERTVKREINRKRRITDKTKRIGKGYKR